MGCVFMILLLFMRRDQKRKDCQIDEGIVSADDFTVIIKGLPTN
jgi:hypothetical protein